MDQFNEQAQPDRVEEYLTLLNEAEHSLKLYVIAMVPVIADAEDILQDTKMTIWKDFESYTSGTHFGAWARKIAFNRIIAFRKRKAIERKRLVFSDAFYETVDQHTEIEEQPINERMETLLNCIAKLQPDHRQAMLLRYQNKLSIEAVAEQLGRTMSATYRLVSRIRLALKDCVQLQEPV